MQRSDASIVAVDASTDGGLERRPDFEPPVTIQDAEPHCGDLNVLDDDDFDVEDVSRSRLDPRLQRAARLAALDPNDGIPL